MPRRALPLFATVVAAAAIAAGCSDPHAGELLLADASGATPAGSTPGVRIWAVEPGEPADDDTLMTDTALSPLDITSTAKHDQVWVNSLGRVWNGDVLLAYGTAESGVVSAGRPGADQEELARSTRADTTVRRRGAYVQTTEGCVLATAATDTERIGEGSCTVSPDERWVASWSPSAPGMTIRDLRSGSTERVDDLQVNNAVALSRDARILAVVATDEGQQGVVIDATDGRVVGRTETYSFLDVDQVDGHSKGFVLLALRESPQGQSPQAQPPEALLLHVDTGAKVTTIDRGRNLLPITNGGEVTYLRYGDQLAESSLRRWHKGEEPEELLGGFVGAGSPDGKHVIATKETAEGTEFWTEQRGTGELRLALTLDRAEGEANPLADPATAEPTGQGPNFGVRVAQMHVMGSMVHLQVDGVSTGSYVRIDLRGGKSDAPVRHASGLRLDSLDSDGTALVLRDSGEAPTDPAQPREQDVLVVRPHEKSPDRRATVNPTGANLLHDGVIYLSVTTGQNTANVVTLRATGSDTRTGELYVGKLIAGATWPQWGGATRSAVITPRLLIEQQQAQQQQQIQAQAAAQGQAQGQGQQVPQ